MLWQELEVSTRRRVEIRDITEEVAGACRATGVADGLAVVVCEHTTAGLCINEAEPRLLADLVAALERLVPARAAYGHNTIDDNADAHLRAILLGHAVTVPLMAGTVGLGQWQRVLFVELDGPRRRRMRLGVFS